MLVVAVAAELGTRSVAGVNVGSRVGCKGGSVLLFAAPFLHLTCVLFGKRKLPSVGVGMKTVPVLVQPSEFRCSSTTLAWLDVSFIDGPQADFWVAPVLLLLREPTRFLLLLRALTGEFLLGFLICISTICLLLILRVNHFGRYATGLQPLECTKVGGTLPLPVAGYNGCFLCVSPFPVGSENSSKGASSSILDKCGFQECLSSL